MVPLKYTKAVRDLITYLEDTQLSQIDKAADIIIESLRNGGALLCAGIGHNNQDDFLDRAGGMAAIQKFSYTFNVNSGIAECRTDRPRPETVEADLEAIRLAVRSSELRAGDVLVLGSVSGKSRNQVELALACRNEGIRVIGITSLDYTSQVESAHPSSKKLCDVVDVVLDNGAPYGDAAVEIPGFDISLLPVSGVGALIIGWMLWGRVMEKMAEAGDPPSVFMSINREGGQDYYEKSKAHFNKRGY